MPGFQQDPNRRQPTASTPCDGQHHLPSVQFQQRDAVPIREAHFLLPEYHASARTVFGTSGLVHAACLMLARTTSEVPESDQPMAQESDVSGARVATWRGRDREPASRRHFC